MRIIPLEKRLMLDASLAGLITSIVIPEADANANDTIIDTDNDVTISGTTTDFNGETLSISTTGGAEDQLSINNEGTGAGQISVSGTDVSYEGIIIGSITSDGSNGSNLDIDFNANTSQAAIERLIENVTYRNISDTPTANRTINFSLGVLFSENVAIGVAPDNDVLVAGNNTGITVGEGATIGIGSTQLSTTDADNTADEIIYTVTSAPIRGQLELTTNSGVAINSFTQENIDNGELIYVHNGNQSTFDKFDFTVSDGTDNLVEDSFDIAVTITNDAPTITTNNAVTASLGFTTTIGGTADDFGTQDNSYAPNTTFATFQGFIDGQDSQLRFVFTTPASIPTDVPGEVLFESGGAGVGMTLALNANNELALYAGAATSTPRLLSPISLETSTQYSVVIEVSDSDNQLRMFYEEASNHDWFYQGRPANATLSGFTTTDFVGTDNGGYGLPNSTGSFGGFNGTPSGTGVFQGTLDSNLIISSAPSSTPTANNDLVTFDSDTPPGQIIYTITNDVDDGVLYRDGVTIGLGDTFTQVDLNKGLITYDSVTDPTGPDIDTFEFSVTDGNTPVTGTYTINVDTVNVAPEIYDENVIYTEDFSGGTTGWNHNTTTPDAILSEFWGRFNRNIDGPSDQDLSQTFTLSGTQEYITVSFDLLEIDTWDNEEFFIFIDDTRYTIANNLHHNRFDRPNDVTNSNITSSVTELSNANGYILGRADTRDQIYRYEISIPNTASSIKLGFGTNLNATNFNDESFGIDNLQISELVAGGTGTRTIEVSELVTNGERIARVEAGDDDVGQSLTYSITGGTGAAVFSINANGDIIVDDATQIDFETMPTSYTLNVQVRDNGPGLLTDTQTITINIRDALENTRPNIDNQTFSFSEDAANGTSVGTPTFTDPEGDGIERWQIIDGNELGVFRINATTGEITIDDNSTVNFENDNRYDIRLRAWDDADLGLFDDHTIRIDVTNVDDAPTLSPEFIGENSGVPNVLYSSATGNFYRFVDTSVNYATALANAEAAILNGVAGQLLTVESAAEKAFVNSISDQHLWMGISDAAAEGVWRYTSGPNEGLQLWDGARPADGGVPTNGFYTDWRGTAEPNNGTAHNGAIFFRNDGRWVDAPLTSNYRYMIEWEGTEVVNNDTYFVNYDTPTDLNDGDVVGTVQGLDPEGDTLTYSIQGGTGSALFNLNPTTGEVTIADASLLNPLIDYTLTVRATEDNGTNQFDETTITIVLNENLSIDNNNGHAATEGTTTIINPTTELTVTDGDGVATDILFDIDTFPLNGQLQLTTNPGVGIIQFTLDDLNNSRVQYVHDGTETLTDSFTFNVTDGGQTLPLETFNITITPVNDAPSIDTNTGATVLEGGTQTITNAMLETLDIDNTDAQLTYTASNFTRGSIEVGGVPGNVFTQSQLNAGDVVFHHNGDEGATASFDISVADTGGLTDTGTFTFTVTPQNDPVAITTNTGFSMLEGGTFTITTGELNITDPDDSGTDITYYVDSVTGGQVRLSTAPTIPVLDFTQADLDAGRVRFVHDGSEQNASFNVRAEDGSTNDTATVNITRIPVNDAPSIFVNTGSSVNEGGLTLINELLLAAQDPDNTPTEITFAISGEVNGQLELLSNLGTQITSFTQSQLNAGDVVFRHDGTSTTVASFDFNASDGTLSSGPETFNMTVDNVNDPPVISVGSTPTVLEGQSVPITTTELNSIDPDNLPAFLTYTVTSTTAGDVQLSGVNTTTFTQADLAAGLISFRHDGSETTAASFNVTLSDGALTDTATVNLNVTPVNDQATLIVNDGDPNIIDFNDFTIDVHDPSQDGGSGRTAIGTPSVDGTTLTITGNAWKKIDIPYALTANTVLSFEFRADSIKDIHGIAFDNDTIINPLFGYQLAGTQTWNGTDQSFNNYEVSDGWVRYDIPIGSDFVGNMSNLVFIRDNDDNPVGGFAEYRNVNFYEAGAILDLNEGDTFNITTAHITTLDVDDSGVDIDYTVSNLRNGVVQVSGVATTTFTQADLDNGDVTFVHDGSDTLNGGFDISMADGLENGAVAQTDTFNLIINPVNDDTVLNTNTTLNLDENATAVISSTNLNITDSDNSPNDVVITITSAASDGIITRVSAPLSPITSFTLAELNDGVIRYTQQGAENASDSFDFSVSDPTGSATTGTFNFTINPINDNTVLIQNNTINIAESGSVGITLADLNTSDADNTRAERVFTITDTDSGWVELTTQAGFPITSFTQNDVANNRVVFRHDGSTATTSSFDFSVSDPTGTATTGTFNLDVTTPVNEGPVVAISDGTPNTIDFNSETILPYSVADNGDGDGGDPTEFNVSNDGTVLTIYGNAWKKISMPMTLTADTVLTFDFRSTRQGEIQGIGFDNDDSVGNGTFAYQLLGTQTSGSLDTSYRTYSIGDGWTRYEIPVGNDFTGAVTDLFFAADDDASADALSQFRNVSIYEANPTITILEGGTSTLSNTNLNVFDTDTPATAITYNVTGQNNGQIQLNGMNTTSFTQDDINNNRVTFAHDGSETTVADFDFTVTDGTLTTTSETFDFTITPVNDAPVTTNNGATVDEGGSVLLGGTSGFTSLNVGGTPTNVLVENVGSDSWILIGRGREGWEFDTNGQGNIADIFTGLGTAAAFDPIAYDDAFVNNLMTALGQNLLNTDVRISRAADVTGTNYQEVTWTNASRSNWSWALTTNQFTVDQTVSDSILGTGVTDIGVDTQDTTPQTGNNYERIWTFDWSGKGGISGFSYGNSVSGTSGDSPTTFLWERTNENHATPYAEIFIKSNAFISDVVSLESTDSDNTPSEIIYTVTSATTNGTLTRGGVTLNVNDTFTQEDFDNGLISYNHDGSETTTDSFDFTVTDGDITLPNDTFDIVINPINDTPVTNNGTITVAEDGSNTIDLNALVTDAEGINYATDVVVSTPSNGTAVLDTATGIVTYTPNANFNGADSFTYTVDDGTGPQVRTINVNVTPVNDNATLVLNTGANVNEMGSVTLTNTMLNTTDIDNVNTEITYTISNISNGHIEVGGVMQSIFTQDDIDNSDVAFIHDGSETTTAAFDLSVVDLTGTPTTTNFAMSVNPMNDNPYALYMDNNLISERETTGFMVANLSTGDVDLPGDTFTYSIMADPDNKFVIVGNQVLLNDSISFAATETLSLTIRTDDNNGGTFDQTFTIDVEKVDSFVAPPSDNFGDASRGLLEEDRVIDDNSRSPLIQGLISEGGLNAAFYGADNLPQIIRDNTQFIVPNINEIDAFNFINQETSADSDITTLENNNGGGDYTRMINFLKSTAEFSGEDIIEPENNAPETNNDKNISITHVQDQFDDALTYHQQRAQQLLDALKDQTSSS